MQKWKEFKESKSVPNQLIKRVVLSMTIINFLILVVVGTYIKVNIRQVEEKYLTEILHNISSTIDNSMKQYIIITEVMSKNSNIIELLEKSDKTNPMQEQELADVVVQELWNIGKDYEEEFVNVYLLDVAQDAYFTQDGSYSGDEFSFATRPYFSAITEQKTVVTTPYLDIHTGKMVLSIVTPVFAGSEVVGAVGIDICTDFITQLIMNSDYGETGSSFVLDENNNVIACHDPSALGESYMQLNVSGAALQREIDNPSESLIEFKGGDGDRIGFVGIIENFDWKIVTAVDLDEYREYENSILRTFIVVLALSVIGLIYIISRTICEALNPLEEIKEAMYELSKGNLQYELEYTSKNEIGILANDLRSTSKQLGIYIKEIGRLLEAFAQGDFTVSTEMEFLGEFASIETSITHVTELITKILVNLKGTAEQVDIGTEQVSVGSQSIAQGAVEQSMEIETLALTTTTIRKKIEASMENATQASELGELIETAMADNHKIMSDLLQAIDEIQESASDIANIIVAINKIADQTNMLSLNAAIEAARSGEQGVGFAVVASEVRNLAQKTKEAAADTEVLITRTLESIEKGTSLTAATQKSFDVVTESSENVLKLVSEIVTTSNEQVESIHIISDGLKGISEVVAENSAISAENTTTAEELSSQATLLKESVDLFKV